MLRVPDARRDAPVWSLAAQGGPAGTAGDRYSVGPVCQGANSSSPMPSSSLLVGLPDATARISSKIWRPTSSSDTPPRIVPQSMSMSSFMWRYSAELVASLIDGTGLQPNTEPRPVVKHTRLAPPATSSAL